MNRIVGPRTFLLTNLYKKCRIVKDYGTFLSLLLNGALGPHTYSKTINFSWIWNPLDVIEEHLVLLLVGKSFLPGIIELRNHVLH